MRRALPWCLAALVVAPVGTATPLKALLESDAPLVVVGALVATSLDALGPGVVRIPESTDARDQALVEATSAKLVLRRWVAGPLDLAKRPLLPNQADAHVTSFNVTAAHFDLRLVRPAAQVAVFRAPDRTTAATHLNARAARCTLEPNEPEPGFQFPRDDNRLPNVKPVPLTTGARSLRAECGTDAFEARDPGTLWIYGLDLFLTSNERHRLIRTGTYGDRDELTGMRRDITAVLEVRRTGAPVRASFPFETAVVLHAGAFHAMGDLTVGPSHGNLTWGELALDGTLEPFRAWGTFVVGWNSPGTVEVRGETLESPSPVVDPPHAAAWIVVAAVVVVSLAGGALIALPRLALLLYSLLHPESASTHPRRGRILMFVREHPGASVAQVAQNCQLRWSKAFYHVGRLRQAGHVIVARVGGRTALFPTRTGYAGSERRLGLLRRPRVREIHDALARCPGLDAASIGTALGLTRQHVSQVLRLMNEAGLVSCEPRSRRKVFFASPVQSEASHALRSPSLRTTSSSMTTV